jgi:DNA-directed RNA polymerase specialized sigma24 family protein
MSGDGVQIGHISNRTMEIALQYQDIMQRMNNETVSDIMRELGCLEAEVQRIELYLSLLEGKKEQVIRLSYFDGMSLIQIARELQMAKRTVIKYRNEALGELMSMYSFIDTVKNKKQE